VLACCRLAVTAGPGGDIELAPADQDPFTRAVGTFAAAIAEAAVAGHWARLKSCPGHHCGWGVLRPFRGRPVAVVLHAAVRFLGQDARLPRQALTPPGACRARR
jgi:hypothetical protein